MKKIMRLLIIIVLIFPLFIKADTYRNAVNSANNIINEDYFKKTYEKYILIGKKTKYEYSNGVMKYNSSFKNGGFISMDEFNLTKVNGRSYLVTSDDYWTLTKSKKSTYVISQNDMDTPRDQESDNFVRITEYIKPKTVVSGSGTENDPWEFDPMYKVTVIVNPEYANIDSGNNEYVKGNCTSAECTATVKLSGKSGYRYITNDCDGVYDIKTKILTIKNVKKNLECNVEFGYGLFTINITNAKPDTFYAIYGEDYYSDVDSKTVIKSLTTVKEKKGYTFGGFSYDDVLIVDKNKKIVKNSVFNITKDLTMDPIYEPNKYTVIFNCSGGYDAPKNQSVTFDSEYTLIKELCKKEGYIQTGWIEKTDGKEFGWTAQNRSKWNWNIDGNVTLYATWNKCDAGTYASITDNTCTKCPAGTYSAAAAGKCTPCPTGYTSEEGSDAVEKCFIKVEAGKHIENPKSNKAVECPKGTYKAEHSVSYGSSSNCTQCPGGYGFGDKLEDKTDVNKCLRIVPAGYYVAAAKASGNTICETGYYSKEQIVHYGETSKCSICPTGYRDGTKIENKVSEDKCSRNVAAGYYIATPKSINNTLCPNGHYNKTHSITYGETSKCNLCPEGYQDGRKLNNKTAKETCLKNVPAGSYVSYEKDEETRVCGNGFYKEAHSLTYGETSKCDACPEGYRDGVTVSNKTSKNKCLKNVSAGFYIAQPNDSTNTLCKDGYYKAKHGVTYGQTSTCTLCPEGYRDGKSAINKSSKESCTRIVDAGYYVASANATQNTMCEDGKYKTKHTITYGETSSCNNCPEGYRNGTTIESKTAESKCIRHIDAGYYIVSAKATNNTECGTGYYKLAHDVAYGTVSRCTVCPSGYRNGTKTENKVSEDSCIRSVPSNHYVATPKADKDTTCPAGTSKGAHTVLYGQTSSCN